MLDFLQIRHGHNQKGQMDVWPDFRVGRSKDLMVQGEKFYAIWHQERGLWSTDPYDVQILVDEELKKYADNLRKNFDGKINIKYMSGFSSGSWTKFLTFVTKLADQFKQLDTKVVFLNDEVVKKDYISRRLHYPLEDRPTPVFDELMNTLYSEDDLHKIMWSIGSIVDGASKDIQKLFILFGAPGTGKSTVLNLIQSLFPGYYTNFEASSLTTGNSSFAAEVFRDNPLIGINHEAELSGIRDNSLLNSIVAHDRIVMNVKYKSNYAIRLNTMLFAATNKPVNITDNNSGLLRRLIDIRPTGNKVLPDRYDTLISKIEFELGPIAYKCLQVYRNAGKGYYSRYRPVDMLMRTNTFANFVDEYYFEFERSEHVTLKRAWDMYKQYCENSNIEYKLPRYKFRDELRTYFLNYEDVKRVGGKQLRSVYMGFDTSKFESKISDMRPEHTIEDKIPDWLVLTKQPSLLDDILKDQPAQYGGKMKYWENVTTKLSDIKTSRIHHVLPPKNLITIDFDLKDESGSKSTVLNLEAALKFPPTYAEMSKGGKGIHLEYYYEGDVSQLSRIFEPDIEVLAPIGKFSIRRKVTKCNNHPITTISSGLPLKGARTKMLSKSTIKSERTLRSLVLQNLNLEIHQNTKPSIDFIAKLLREANESDLIYDLSDLKTLVVDFASKSSNQAEYCMGVAIHLPYESTNDTPSDVPPDDHKERLTFFDIEVFKNLILICWKYAGASNMVRMFNPKPEDIEALLQHNLVGFNNRRYDNHILWAILLGMNNQQVYDISHRIVNNDRSALFREAYRLSYADAFEISSIRQSLKKWQLQLGLPHKEMDHPWDVPLPEEKWGEAADYCDNDVLSTEDVFVHNKSDFNARKILSVLSGRSVNDSTLSHTSQFLFNGNRNPQNEFNYPNLADLFPGYEFKQGKSSYRGENPSEGGYVYAEPGIYRNVAYLDIASMHPTSIEMMEMFGPYTQKYSEIKKARMLVKVGDFKSVKKMFGGRLAPYLGSKEDAKDLDRALKLILNSVYGFTFAGFPNAFKDPRNVDNVVAKRGALFMIDLKHALQEKGIKCIHFKTDSVKIADYKPEDIEFVKEFGKKYGYDFGVEGIYKKLTLVNDAVLIGQWEDTGEWDAVGARFARPYIYKTLFSKEPITVDDMRETRAVVKGSMYIDTGTEADPQKAFVGKIGAFHPMKFNGGSLLRIDGEKQAAVSDTKGYQWLEAETVNKLGYEKMIDTDYFDAAVLDAVKKIATVGNPELIIDKQTLKSIGYQKEMTV